MSTYLGAPLVGSTHHTEAVVKLVESNDGKAGEEEEEVGDRRETAEGSDRVVEHAPEVEVDGEKGYHGEALSS